MIKKGWGLLLPFLMGFLLVPTLAMAEPGLSTEASVPKYAQIESEPTPLGDLVIPEADESDEANEAVEEDEPVDEEDEAQASDPAPTTAPSVRSVYIEVMLSDDVVFPGGSFQATCKVLPNGASQQVEWSSSSSIITVDASGFARVATPIMVAENGVYVDIWARATDGSLSMNCKTVRVMPGAQKLRFFERELTLSTEAEQKTVRVMVELVPAALYGEIPVEWSSSDPSIASVYAAGMNGEVGVISWTDALGSAVIKAQASDGSGISDQLSVVIVP